MRHHPIFTDREVCYIHRTPLSVAQLAADFGVTEDDVRTARRLGRTLDDGLPLAQITDGVQSEGVRG